MYGYGPDNPEISATFAAACQTEISVTGADQIVVLRDGRLEQVGSPMELYDNPVKKFVAGFLGSPSMNFNEASFVSLDGAKTLGIRPEHLSIVPSGRLKGTVTHVERLGWDTHVFVKLQSGDVMTVWLFRSFDHKYGSVVEMDFNNRDAFFFDEFEQQVQIPFGTRDSQKRLARYLPGPRIAFSWVGVWCA